MITKSSLVSGWVTSGCEPVNTGTSDGALSSFQDKSVLDIISDPTGEHEAAGLCTHSW